MAIFGKSPREKWIEEHSKKIRKIFDDGCDHSGVLVAMGSQEPSPCAIAFDSVSDFMAKYYLQADGLIHLCAISTPDEYDGLKINSWGLGYAGHKPETLYFRCEMMPWVYAIHSQSNGDAIDWFKKNYKSLKGKMG
jgi:hypothetical protein